MRRCVQDKGGHGMARPAERATRINDWIGWGLDAGADDPAELVAALEQAGLALE